MSSAQSAKSLNANALHLIRSVLVTAGLRGVNSDESSDSKRDALLFVTAAFRNGSKTKLSLLKALAGRKLLSTFGKSTGQDLTDLELRQRIKESGQ